MKIAHPVRIILPAIALLVIALRSHAACDDLVSKVNETLHYPKPKPEAASFDLSDCKPWPGNPGQVILAIARYKAGSDFGTAGEQPGEGLYDLDILVLDEKSGRILQRLVQPDALTSDAERLSSISVDTARYRLAAGVRAFGVQAQNTHMGGTNSERTSIRLFAMSKGKLAELLPPIDLGFSTNTRSNTNCVELRQTFRTIVIGKKTTNGYADLRINEKQVEPEMTMTATGCEEVSKISKRSYTIRFDGTQYAMPPELKQ